MGTVLDCQELLGDKWNRDGYFKFGINDNGMDIPINRPGGQLFGGTVSFIPTGMKDGGSLKDASGGYGFY
jgi:hypothetical protein